jgi:ATP-dependent helicase HrpB
MLLRAGRAAAPLAALLADRDPLRGASADLASRLQAIKDGPAGPADRAGIERIRTEARRLAKGLPEGPGFSPAQMAALAYPDRIGQRRKGGEPRFLLSGGKGAWLEAGDPLAGVALIVATDLDGDAREARVRLATAISEGEVREVLGDRIQSGPVCAWSSRDQRVLARLQERLGAVVLSDNPWADPPPQMGLAAMLEGVREIGLRFSPAAARFRARVGLLREGGEDLPDMSDAGLMADLERWLAPYLGQVRTAAQFRQLDLLPALRARLDWGQMQRLDAEAPGHFQTPLGRQIPISYDGEVPEISIRLQEMFGVTRHPTVGRTPIRVTLLSPGSKSIQVTTDIPGFWASSYADVRKEMRGRYPRHPWPEDPTEAEPTLRAKPRGT